MATSLDYDDNHNENKLYRLAEQYLTTNGGDFDS